MHRPHLARAAVVAFAATITLAACGGGGGSSAGAALTTTPSTSGTATAGTGAPEGTGHDRQGPGGGRFGGQFQALAQCLQEQGLAVAPADGSRPPFDGQPPADGSRPDRAPPADGSRPQADPAQMASRLAARLGLDPNDEATAAAIAACSAQLG